MKVAIAIAATMLAAAPLTAADPLAPLDDSTPGFAMTAAHGGSPSAYGSIALRAGVTIYDARFRRVAKTDANAPIVREAAAPLAGLGHVAQLARAKQIVADRVRYKSDPDAMRVADLWANAGETLQSGQGDDEDIAIATMQMLKAAGYPEDDLYLSVGRHPARGAHIVLLARTEDGYYMLDHLQTAPVKVDAATNAFRPILSVGRDGSWVHGYRTARR